MSTEVQTLESALEGEADWARDWLFQSAAPLWATRGREPTGLFAERMTLSAEPDRSYFRTFVQARHIFSYVALGRMGWGGPWEALVSQTMNTLVEHAKRADGFYVHRLNAGAQHLDERADLYDQAFVLLALGSAGGALSRRDWFDEAEHLLDKIQREWSHPAGGYTEGEIVDASMRRQNPHMHLLEAFIALYKASGRDRFEAAALEIADLAATKFIDPGSGALLEYFDDDLRPAPGDAGRKAEPGHCFEWAWLFELLAADGWSCGVGLSDGLVSFARDFGLDRRRKVATNEVLTDGTISDGNARLWPQTERMKAAVARFRRLHEVEDAQEAIASAEGLKQYLDVSTPGLWRDKLKTDGSWVDELAPGSSLYHISCAMFELSSTA